MLHRDPITTDDYLALADVRDTCVSVYLPTTPVSTEADTMRLTAKNLITRAMERVEDVTTTTESRAIEAALRSVEDDPDFWREQAHGLAILTTPSVCHTIRLAYPVAQRAQVAAGFHLRPLTRALEPQTLFVLAISQKDVTLFHLADDHRLTELTVDDLPVDFGQVTGRTLQRDPAPARRLQGQEGARVLQSSFIRAVEDAVTRHLAGSDVPLVLATTEDLAAIYREFNRYSNLLDTSIIGAVGKEAPHRIREAAIEILDEVEHRHVEDLVARFEEASGSSRVTDDLADVAQFASRGQIDRLLVTVGDPVPGWIDDHGAVTLAGDDPTAPDVLDEIVRRVVATGGDVTTTPETSGAAPVAAMLRWVDAPA